METMYLSDFAEIGEIICGVQRVGDLPSGASVTPAAFQPVHTSLSFFLSLRSSLAMIPSCKVTRGDFLPEVTKPTTWCPTRGARVSVSFK